MHSVVPDREILQYVDYMLEGAPSSRPTYTAAREQSKTTHGYPAWRRLQRFSLAV